MHRARALIVILLASFPIISSAQSNLISGRIVGDSAGVKIGIPGIEIHIPSTGFTTKTDANGNFSFLPSGPVITAIVARFSARDSDIFYYDPNSGREPLLVKDMRQIKTIEITGKKVDSKIDSRGLYKSEILNEGEFKKAACCTLSESFETNNTVSVSNADGVSGIRQVEMLGLPGKYVLMTRDNIPTVRGLIVLTGLDQIPGPMVGGVHIAKGMGSVTNGYEGITGGINYALKSEPNEPRLFVNTYANSQYRAELNLIASQKIGKRLFNYAYLHLHSRYRAMDYGKDGIADMPLSKMIYVGDYIKLHENKFEFQLGFNYVNSQKWGGDVAQFETNHPLNDLFRFSMNEERAEVFGKLGIFLNKDGSSSIGNIFSVSSTRNQSLLNSLVNRSYNATHNNVLYTGLWGTPDSKKWSFKSGINLVLDQVSEQFSDTFISMFQTQRNEFSAGLFSEVVYKGKKLLWVIGLRADHDNIYSKSFFTPRIHMKYDISKNQQLHFQSGIGRRTPWLFADNLPLFISSRKVITTAITGNTPEEYYKGAYFLSQEKAYNGGISYTRQLMVFGYPSTLSADAFYTYFFSQTVADRDMNIDQLLIKTEKGNRTTMIQADWTLKPHRRIDIKLSYRYVNSQMNLGGLTRLQALLSPHRGLIVFDYETRRKWYFDFITQVTSAKRLPSTQTLLERNRQPVNSPWFALINLQIRKEFKHFDLYAGCENLLNYFQSKPVLNVTENGIQHFDAAFTWGPTMGRNIFAGFRWTLK